MTVTSSRPASRGRGRILTALLAAATLAAGLLPALPAAAEGLPHSNTFDGWTITRSGSPEVAFSTTPDGHTGSALQMVNETPKAPNTFGQIFQTVGVEPSTRYRFTAWVASDGLPSTGALQAIFSPDWAARYDFPTGTYDWRQVSWSYTTGPSETSLTLRLLSQDATPRVRVDDVTMSVDGSEQNLLVNGGFEEFSTYFGVTNDSLLFDPGTAEIKLLTDAPGASSATWTVRDVRGTTVTDGTATVVDGRAVVDLSSLPNGFYTFEATSPSRDESVSLTTGFGIVPEMPEAANSPASPFGVGIHSYEPELIEGMARIGYAHARTDVGWSDVELSPGEYTFPSVYTDGFAALDAAGIEPLPISNYRNPLYDDNRTPSSPEGLDAYGRYTAAVNQHFSEHTKAVEIYNEFNINFNDGACGRTPACYAELLAAAAEHVDAQNPDALLVGPAISGASADYVREVLELGGAEVLDAVSVHPYRHPSPPEGMDTQIAGLNQTIESAAGRSLPLWLTEYGWPTHIAGRTSEAMKADYVVRAAVLSLAGGADRLYWYDARDDGTDPENAEHNFGIFEEPRAAIPSTVEPKPAAVAQAVMAAELAGRHLSGRDELDESTYSFAFTSGDEVTRVMWAPNAATTVTLRAEEPLTLTDQYGAKKTLNPRAGVINVTLTEHPVYLSGTVESLAVNADPTVALEASPSVADGESIQVRAIVDRTGTNCRGEIPAKVTVTVEGQSQDVNVKGCRAGEAAFEVPTTSGQTASWVTGSVAVGSNTVAHLATATVPVTTPVVASTEVRLSNDGGYGADAIVTVANKSRQTELTLEDLVWTLEGDSGTVEERSTLAPGQEIEIVLPLAGLTLWQHAYLDVEVGLEGRDDIKLRQSVGIGPIEADGQSTVPPIDLATHARWERYTADWGGPTDLSGPVTITETANGLRFRASVEDDVHSQTNPAGAMYNGDSIQVSFSPASPGSTLERTEVGFALTAAGPEAYTFAASGVAITGPTPTERLQITRSGTTTEYDVVLPWQSLGLTSPPTGTFALSFIVNEDDGPGREGYLEWSSGIGRTKDSSQHFPVQLTSE